MKAEIVAALPVEERREEIWRAGEIVRAGGLVAFPTETVYGLGGNALDGEAAKKIYRAKGRPSDNPLIVHIAEAADLETIVAEVPLEAEILARECWPGPLTMILPKKALVPPETTGGLPSVAVRLPDHPVALEFIRAAGGFVAAPSANTSGRPSPTCAAHVAEDLGEEIQMILDGGRVGIGIESTIVDFTGETPTVLRPGYLSLEELRELIGEVQMDAGLLKAGQRPKAPGMKYRHYAPKAELVIVEGEPLAVTEKINALIAQGEAKGERIGVICARETEPLYTGGMKKCVGSLREEETIARHLYRVLREFDGCRVDRIYSEAFDTPRLGQAVMNRLLKAAGHRVLKV